MSVDYIGVSPPDGTSLGQAAADKVSLHGVTPVIQSVAVTTALTDLTHTAPSTADYAIQALTTTTPYGFVTSDEGNTVLKVVQANKVNIAEIYAALKAHGIMAQLP